MKKDYQKPEVEVISLVAEEQITLDLISDVPDGEMGVGSSIW